VLTVSGFKDLRDRTLDHRICEIAKFDLPEYKGGGFLRLFVGVGFSKGKYKSLVLISIRASGRGKILCAWTSDLRVGRAVSQGCDKYLPLFLS
jgi:hypothetical protein